MKSWVEAYAEDQDLFFTNWARAHVKVSEFAHEENLLSEFDNRDIIDGGYQEVNRLGAILTLIRGKVNQEEDVPELAASNENPNLRHEINITRGGERTERIE